MRFQTKECNRVAGEGAIVLFSRDETRLVDVLIHLHRGAHGGTGEERINDQDRAEMVTVALLSTGRYLSGWSRDVLLAEVGKCQGPDEPLVIAQALAHHARGFVQPKKNFLEDLRKHSTPAGAAFACGQVMQLLLSLSPGAAREAAADPRTYPEYRAVFLQLADLAEQLPAIILNTDSKPIQEEARST